MSPSLPLPVCCNCAIHCWWCVCVVCVSGRSKSMVQQSYRVCPQYALFVSWCAHCRWFIVLHHSFCGNPLCCGALHHRSIRTVLPIQASTNDAGNVVLADIQADYSSSTSFSPISTFFLSIQPVFIVASTFTYHGFQPPVFGDGPPSPLA